MIRQRIRKLLIALVDYLDDYGYFDDEIRETCIEDTEDMCYDRIMKDDELHLLTTDTVKYYIHLLFTDFDGFSAICRQYKAF